MDEKDEKEPTKEEDALIGKHIYDCPICKTTCYYFWVLGSSVTHCIAKPKDIAAPEALLQEFTKEELDRLFNHIESCASCKKKLSKSFDLDKYIFDLIETNQRLANKR